MLSRLGNGKKEGSEPSSRFLGVEKRQTQIRVKKWSPGLGTTSKNEDEDDHPRRLFSVFHQKYYLPLRDTRYPDSGTISKNEAGNDHSRRWFSILSSELLFTP